MLARQVARLCSRLMLTQNRDDLLFRNRFLFISPSFNRGRTLISDGGNCPWQVSYTLKPRVRIMSSVAPATQAIRPMPNGC